MKFQKPDWLPVAKRLLEERGLKKDDLAPVLGVTPGAVSHWFTGRNKMKTDKLLILCKFLGVDLDYLMGVEKPSLSEVDDQYYPKGKDFVAALQNVFIGDYASEQTKVFYKVLQDQDLDTVMLLAKAHAKGRIDGDVTAVPGAMAQLSATG
jgi:transcriptional regulator with XRE-family HTH domain